MASEEPLARVRAAMRGLKAPGHYDKVYKEECMYSFDTPESPGGLFVNLRTWQVCVVVCLLLRSAACVRVSVQRAAGARRWGAMGRQPQKTNHNPNTTKKGLWRRVRRPRPREDGRRAVPARDVAARAAAAAR